MICCIIINVNFVGVECLVFLVHLLQNLPCLVPGDNSESGRALRRHSDYVLEVISLI